MTKGKRGPFPETAATLLARARTTRSPVEAYGYFLAKTGELFGNRETAERCKQFWLRCVARDDEPGTDIHSVEGVSAWRPRGSAQIVILVVAQDASTGRIGATRLSARAQTPQPVSWPELACRLPPRVRVRSDEARKRGRA